MCLSAGTRGGTAANKREQMPAEQRDRVGPRSGIPPSVSPYTTKPQPPPSSQSNKTMAPRRLIKWLMEGVRALPSASHPPPPTNPQPPRMLSRRFSLPAALAWRLQSGVPANKCLPGQRVRNPAQSNSCRGVIESPIISLTIIPSQLSPHLRIRVDRCGGTAMHTL